MENISIIESYKQEFIQFLAQSGAIKFGEFKLKSGRVAPWFVNTGMFNNGETIKKLGYYYASAIRQHFPNLDAIYGPAYKGIPLCVTASIALSDMGLNKSYVFNRKEVKNYGEKDNLVGMPVNANTNLVIVDDVITAGTSVRESLEILKHNGNPKVMGIIISVNRQERGLKKNALKEVEEDLGIPIHAIVTLTEIKQVLHNQPVNGKVYLDDNIVEKIDAYIKEYGAV